MKQKVRIWMVGTAAAVAMVAGSPALAQGALGCPGFGPGYWRGDGPGPHMMEGTPGRMDSRPGRMRGGPDDWAPGQGTYEPGQGMRNHLTALKEALKLTPEQQSAWNSFNSLAEKHADRMGTRYKERQTLPATLPERIDFMQKRATECDQDRQQMGDALKALYEKLTPEQRKVMDERGLRMLW